jgi:selenocysteine lyase/cysteine desulfurase
MSTTIKSQISIAPINRDSCPLSSLVACAITGMKSRTLTDPAGRRCRAVAEAMTDYLYHHNANTHWAYPTSAETDAAIENAREVCASFS